MRNEIKIVISLLLFIVKFSFSQSSINFSVNITSLPTCSTCCDGTAVVPYLSISGGCNQPYYYYWSSGSATATENNFCYNTTYSVTVYDICDSTTKAFTFPIYTNIFELININTLKIYPNPVMEKLNIEPLNNEAVNIKLDISNSLGQLLFSLDKFDSKQEIDLSFLASGVYYITLQGNSKTKTFKVIKE